MLSRQLQPRLERLDGLGQLTTPLVDARHGEGPVRVLAEDARGLREERERAVLVPLVEERDRTLFQDGHQLTQGRGVGAALGEALNECRRLARLAARQELTGPVHALDGLRGAGAEGENERKRSEAVGRDVEAMHTFESWWWREKLSG